MEQIQVRRRLMVALYIYEATVILACLASGYVVATSNGGNAGFAFMLIMVAAAEMLRIPLSAWMVHVSPGARIICVGVLLAIAVLSAEGLSLGVEMAITNRIQSILHAERLVEMERGRVEIAERAGHGASADVEGARADEVRLSQLIKDTPAPTPPATNDRVCQMKNGRTGTCYADRQAQVTYSKAVDAYNANIEDLKRQQRAAHQRVIELATASSTKNAIDRTLLNAAETELADLKMQSPMHRLAASWFGVRIFALTDEQFESVKRVAITVLAGAFATLSMLVSIAAHSRADDGRPGKLSRALRAWFARRRKKVVRVERVVVPGPKREVVVEKRVDVPGPERRIEVLVPYDFSSGRRINPDATLGDRLSPSALRTVEGGRK